MEPIKTNKIALSFDVEDWYHSSMMSGMYFSKHQSREELLAYYTHGHDYLTEPFEVLINLLDKYQLTATFFIVASIVEHYPRIVELLRGSRHEIASHSLYHEGIFVNREQTQLRDLGEWEEEQKKAKEILENVFSKPVVGFRAPFALFSIRQIGILEKIGFKYDSSLGYNSIFNKSDIEVLHTPAPYYLHTYLLTSDGKRELVELPWSYYQLGPVALPAAGAFFYRLLGNSFFSRVLNQCLKKGDTMFYLHPLEMSEKKLPTVANINRPFVWINKGNATVKRLDKLLSRYKNSIVTCEEVYRRFVQQQYA